MLGKQPISSLVVNRQGFIRVRHKDGQPTSRESIIMFIIFIIMIIHYICNFLYVLHSLYGPPKTPHIASVTGSQCHRKPVSSASIAHSAMLAHPGVLHVSTLAPATAAER